MYNIASTGTPYGANGVYPVRSSYSLKKESAPLITPEKMRTPGDMVSFGSTPAAITWEPYNPGKFNMGTLLENVTPIEPVSMAGAIGERTGSLSSKKTSSNVPTFIDMVDNLESDFNYHFPYEDAQAMTQTLRNWGDTRENALRQFDQMVGERNFAMEAMEQRLKEIAEKKTALQTKMEAKKAAKEEKQRKLEESKNDVENLKETGSKEEIESKLNEVNGKISDTQSNIGSKEDQIAKLKEEIENNPDKKEELQKKIDDLNGEIREDKQTLNKQTEQKRELQQQKKVKEKKAKEAKRKKERAEREINRLKEEIETLNREEADLKETVGEFNEAKEKVSAEKSQKETEMEKLEWIINDFRFDTQGM